MLDAIKDDFKPTVTKVNDALSQQQIMIEVLNKSLTAIKSNFGIISNQTSRYKHFSKRVTDHLNALSNDLMVNEKFEVFVSSSLVLNTYLDLVSLDIQIIKVWYVALHTHENE